MGVVTRVEDGVATILLDRPEVRNAIDLDLIEGIGEAVSDVSARGARAAVLAGAGGAFCAGVDLRYVRGAFEGDAEAVLRPLVDALHRVVRRLRDAPFPVVAALEGPAVGAGMGLALAADVRVAARSAVLIPGYFGIGASPDGGVSYFLVRAAGGARAAASILRNRTLGADELATWGLVEEVVEDGQALKAGLELAVELASVPPLALMRLRRLVDAATRHGLADHLDLEKQLVAELWPTADFREGVGAFFDRRKPQFEGR